MHQEPPQNGNLARRHNQMFHKKGFLKMADKQWKDHPIFQNRVFLCAKGNPNIGSAYHSSAKLFMQLFSSSKPSATRNSSQ